MSQSPDKDETGAVEHIAEEINGLPGVHKFNDAVDHAEEVVEDKVKGALRHLRPHKD